MLPNFVQQSYSVIPKKMGNNMVVKDPVRKGYIGCGNVHDYNS